MRQCFAIVAVLALVLGPSGCDKSGKESGARTAGTSTSQLSGPAVAKPSGSPSEVSDATEEAASPGTPIPGPTGRIEGTVTFVGDEIPKSTVVTNTTDPQLCGTELSKHDKVISPETRGIRYVLVGLEGVKLPDGYKPPLEKLILDNKKCQFEPHAAVLTVGSTIETRNSDEVYHTTNLKGRLTTENIPLTGKGTLHKTRVRWAELIGVSCDKHGWMQAFIRVDPHPFHGVTDADGKFVIADVPVGSYKLKAWHEYFYGQELEVSVTSGETTTLWIQYPTAE